LTANPSQLVNAYAAGWTIPEKKLKPVEKVAAAIRAIKKIWPRPFGRRNAARRRAFRARLKSSPHFARRPPVDRHRLEA